MFQKRTPVVIPRYNALLLFVVKKWNKERGWGAFCTGMWNILYQKEGRQDWQMVLWPKARSGNTGVARQR